MKIDVFDSYANDENGKTIHFDVLVPSDSSPEQALTYGREWLESIGQSANGLQQTHCNFCHSEMANPAVQKAINNQGYFILQMEGCPSPIY